MGSSLQIRNSNPNRTSALLRTTKRIIKRRIFGTFRTSRTRLFLSSTLGHHFVIFHVLTRTGNSILTSNRKVRRNQVLGSRTRITTRNYRLFFVRNNGIFVVGRSLPFHQLLRPSSRTRSHALTQTTNARSNRHFTLVSIWVSII